MAPPPVRILPAHQRSAAMPSSPLMSWALVLVWALVVATSTVTSDDSPFLTVTPSSTCNDGTELSSACGFPLPDLDSNSYCSGNEVLAVRGGCHVCVDPSTCGVPELSHSEPPATDDDFFNDSLPIITTTAEAAVTVAETTSTVPPAALPSSPALTQNHADPDGPEAAALRQSTTTSLKYASRPQLPFQGVAHGYFLIPAFLALVGVGLALKARMEDARDEFERVRDDDAEEINPFCAEPVSPTTQDDDGPDDHAADLEFGRRRYADDDDDDGAMPQRVRP